MRLIDIYRIIILIQQRQSDRSFHSKCMKNILLLFHFQYIFLTISSSILKRIWLVRKCTIKWKWLVQCLWAFFITMSFFLTDHNMFIWYFSSILCERKMKNSENFNNEKIMSLTAYITAVLFRISNSIFNFFLQLLKISKALKICIQFEVIFIQCSNQSALFLNFFRMTVNKLQHLRMLWCL